MSELSETPSDASASTTSVHLLVRPGKTVDAHLLPLPSLRRLFATWAGAIAIGSSAAIVGAYYITLTIDFSGELLRMFLVQLTLAIVLAILAMYPLHLRLTRNLRAWLREPGDGVSRPAWREALNYPVHMSCYIGSWPRA